MTRLTLLLGTLLATAGAYAWLHHAWLSATPAWADRPDEIQTGANLSLLALLTGLALCLLAWRAIRRARPPPDDTGA